MSRLNLRLPESLHRRLLEQARNEGVSLHQYVVFSLTRSVTLSELQKQEVDFRSLTNRYPPDKAEAALREILSNRAEAPSR